jgi:hypothetical protein
LSPWAISQKVVRSGHDQRNSRDQQQEEHDLAKTGFVQMSVELQPDPRPGQQCRKAEDEEPSRVRRYCAAYSQPQGAHCKNCDADGLKDGALLVLGPAANAAPHGRENAGETGEAAESSVEKTDPCIRSCAAAFYRRHRRPGEAVSAVEYEHRADRDADMVRPGPIENGNAQRDTKGRTEQERPQPHRGDLRELLDQRSNQGRDRGRERQMDRFLLPTTSVCAVIIAGSDEQIEQTGSMQYRRDCYTCCVPQRPKDRLLVSAGLMPTNEIIAASQLEKGRR